VLAAENELTLTTIADGLALPEEGGA